MVMAGTVHADAKPVDPLVQASNRFGFKLLAAISRQEPRSPQQSEPHSGAEPARNVFLSPVSVSLALGVALSGAAGETRQEMARCLELADLGADVAANGNAGLLQFIHPKDPGIELDLATSLWIPPQVVLRQDFLARSAQTYQAEIVHLGAEAAVPRINAWVREKTRGKIDSIVDQLPPETVLVILNAVYFHGTWAEKFDTKRTQEKPFHLLAGKTKAVSMMSRSGHYPYFEAPDFQAAALAYGDDMIRFEVVLPDSTSSLEKLVARLDADRDWDPAAQLQPRLGEVALPRFTLRFDMTLNDVLKRLGMKRAFDSEAADFSGITGTRDAYIDEVRHKSWIEVNEKGTEAAAVTSVTMVKSSGITHVETPFRLIVDRPFLFIIRDRISGLVLFLGAVADPNLL